MTIRSILIKKLITIAIFSGAMFSFSVQADELKEISDLAGQGQQTAALERINSYLEANPKDAQGMFMKGIILAESGKRNEAISTFTDLTKKYPSLPEPYNNLAVLHAEAGQYDMARKALETAIKTHPSYATAHENLGDIYARMASEAYDKALKLDNGNTRAESKLSLITNLFSNDAKTIVAANGTKPIRPANKKMEAPSPVDVAVAPPTAPVPAAVETNPEEDIMSAVARWANAWSSQDLEGYYASYAESFKPARGASYASWRKLRKTRVTRPSKINLELSKEKVDIIDENNAKVSFKQYYKADSGPIHTNKTLVMKKVDDVWLINQEIASN